MCMLKCLQGVGHACVHVMFARLVVNVCELDVSLC